MAVVRQNPRSDFMFLSPGPKERAEDEREDGAIKMLAGGITKIHSDVATGSW